MNLWQSLVAGSVIGVGGFLGDAMIGALKRDMGIDEPVASEPGRRGVLDRVDSLTLASPLFFHWIYYLFLWHR